MRRDGYFHQDRLVRRLPVECCDDAGVIVRERRGRYSHYALVEGTLDHVAALVALPERAAA